MEIADLRRRHLLLLLLAAGLSCGEGADPPSPSARISAVIVPDWSAPQQRARRVNDYLAYYGAWDAQKIDLAKTYELVICHPTQGNMTRAQIAAIQAGVDPGDPSDDVLVLGYISIGEDIRTSGLTDDEMRLDPRFVGDATGPRVDPRGPDADGGPLAGIDPQGSPSPGGNGYASWYLDDNDVDRNGTGDGRPDRNGWFRSCFVNAGDPAWYDALQAMRRDSPDGVTGLREILTTTYGRGLGCDGVFLDTLDTAAPNYYTDSSSGNQSEFEWTAPGFSNFVKRLRAAYPDRIVFQNRGLFFLDPRHPHFEFTTRGSIDLLLFESYRLNSSSGTDNPDPYFYPDNRYYVAPKIMAEAGRPDGFRVLSLGYAAGPPNQMSELTLIGQSTLGFDSLIEDIRATEQLAGFRHYLTNPPLTLVNTFVRDHRVSADSTPPVWTSTHNTNSSGGIPTEATPRVGLQEVEAQPGALVVRWDVALDMNPVRYTLYTQTSPFNFSSDPDLAGANRIVLTPGMGRAYPSGPGPGVYPYECRVSGLDVGRLYYLLIRTSDELGNEEKNRVVLTGTPLAVSGSAASIVRGPYLQRGGPTRAVVRWRTDVATDSRVSYGPTAGTPSASVVDPALVTEHAVELTGLPPNSRVYYEVGSSTRTLAGGDLQHFVITPPANGLPMPTRAWVLGDAGVSGPSGNDFDQKAVRDAYVTFTGNTHTSLWLMLGDNAYDGGTDAEYQRGVFDIYPGTLRQSVLWPTFGNHDALSADSATQTGPYYSIFTLPRAAEAGGVASNTEAYYSFDYGNIHWICLDSSETSRSPTGTMANWLRQDLAATTADWIVAFFHHPPYSKGGHDSDLETELVQMRQNLLPILEEGGADLVLSGHSHSYERSFLIDGHYGSSSTFASSMKKNGGDGRESGNGPYVKPLARAPHQGTVYVVAGSSGKLTSGPFGHPAMFTSILELGSLVVDVDGNRMDVRFLQANGAVGDFFTMVKSSGPSVAITGPTDQTTWTTPSSPVALSGSSQGATLVRWSNAATGQTGSASGLNPWSASVPIVEGPNEITVTATGPGGSGSDVITVHLTTTNPLTLIPARSAWTFHDRGQDLGTAWRARTYDDASWSSGPGALGYGEKYVATTVSFGPDPARKHITTYFRRTFFVEDPGVIQELTLNVMHDDGFVAYLNGTEIARASMPSGAVSFSTLASSHEAGNRYASFDVSGARGLLLPGNNVLAVEVHQNSRSSSDLAFDGELLVPTTTPPAVAITSPAPGATVGGTATVTATASDTEGVVRVELYVDGSLVATDLTSPYSFAWNTTAFPDGPHTLTARAYDPSGNVGTSAAVSVEVRNAGAGLIPARSVWKYHDQGQDLGTAWRASGFNDSAWASGPGVLGYGESYLATPVSYGGSASAKHMTTYFRKSFQVADPSQIQALTARVMYDDGFVLYVNGVEARRASMPSGSIGFSTAAAGHEANNAYDIFDLTSARSLLVAGTNVVAVEVHQQAPSSSDLVFDLELQSAAGVQTLVPPRSVWKVHDQGQDLGTAWRPPSYDDSAWAQGAGPLGYGESYLSTVVSYGPNASAKHVTTYFRRKFAVSNPAALTALTAQVMYDDGFVLYLNGVEVQRAHLPTGTIAFSTLAQGHEAGNAYVAFDLSSRLSLLVAGENTLSVEVHQQAPTSSDLVFDLSLEGN